MTVDNGRALVVRGGWPGHAPVETTDLFIAFLQESDYDVTIEETLEAYADAEFMAGIDLILQCWTMGEIRSEEMRGLRNAVTGGTGLAGWHGGIVDAFRRATDYLQLVGGQFAGRTHDLVDHTIDIVPGRADHPVVEGFRSVALHSEQYWVLTDSLSDVLATTTIEPGPGDPWAGPLVSPAIWTRRWGAGKVFVCTAGHQLTDLENPDLRTIVERGLLWASR